MWVYYISRDLSRNQLVAIEAGDLANFTQLRKLDLSGNSLSKIEAPFLRELANLEKLKLAYNQIVHVFQGAFDESPQLKQM